MSEPVPDTPEHRKEWIKYQLRLRGITLADIAREVGVTRQCIANALDSRYPKAERLIAQALDRRPEELWPERYDTEANAGR